MTSLNDVEVHVLRKKTKATAGWFKFWYKMILRSLLSEYIHTRSAKNFLLASFIFFWDQNWHYGIQMQQSCKHIRYSNLRSLRVALGWSHSRRQNYSLAIEYLLNGFHHTTWAFSGKVIHSWEAYLKTGKKKRSWRRRMGRKKWRNGMLVSWRPFQ